MPQPDAIDPSAYAFSGGSVGALLIHGFTGAPVEMRMVADYLHERGLTVSGPRLPGHGTSVEDMNRAKWTDWTSHVEDALEQLRSRCETVFVGGLSMGALLTLYLAARYQDLPGAIIYSPAVKIANRLIYLTPLLKHVMPMRSKSGESDLTDPLAAFREVHRVLKPGGSLVVAFIDRGTPTGEIYDANKHDSAFYQEATFYSASEVKAMLEEAGFASTSFVQTIFGDPRELTELDAVKEGFGEGVFCIGKAVK